jgi:hypothetical protein
LLSVSQWALPTADANGITALHHILADAANVYITKRVNPFTIQLRQASETSG